MENAIAVAVIIGLINGFRLLDQKDKTGFYYFLGAVVVGSVFGIMNLFGLNGFEAGLTAALTSSGLYRVGQVISGS